jgi:hypothetical protein
MCWSWRDACDVAVFSKEKYLATKTDIRTTILEELKT